MRALVLASVVLTAGCSQDYWRSTCAREESKPVRRFDCLQRDRKYNCVQWGYTSTTETRCAEFRCKEPYAYGASKPDFTNNLLASVPAKYCLTKEEAERRRQG